MTRCVSVLKTHKDITPTTSISSITRLMCEQYGTYPVCNRGNIVLVEYSLYETEVLTYMET